MDLHALKDEFPRADVEWRAQSVTRDGTKAMALAYIDARVVMDRLDAVCSPENWKPEYVETASGRVICTLSIFTGERWISKADGAGATDIEGDKGGISSALKRAAVAWGVGRYLYDMPTPWVPCESYERNGKRHWKNWTADPWTFVRRSEPNVVEMDGEQKRKAAETWANKFAADVKGAVSDIDAARLVSENGERVARCWDYQKARSTIETAFLARGIYIDIRDGKAAAFDQNDPSRLMAGA